MKVREKCQAAIKEWKEDLTKSALRTADQANAEKKSPQKRTNATAKAVEKFTAAKESPKSKSPTKQQQKDKSKKKEEEKKKTAKGKTARKSPREKPKILPAADIDPRQSQEPQEFKTAVMEQMRHEFNKRMEQEKNATSGPPQKSQTKKNALPGINLKSPTSMDQRAQRAKKRMQGKTTAQKVLDAAAGLSEMGIHEDDKRAIMNATSGLRREMEEKEEGQDRKIRELKNAAREEKRKAESKTRDANRKQSNSCKEEKRKAASQPEKALKEKEAQSKRNADAEPNATTWRKKEMHSGINCETKKKKQKKGTGPHSENRVGGHAASTATAAQRQTTPATTGSTGNARQRDQKRVRSNAAQRNRERTSKANACPSCGTHAQTRETDTNSAHNNRNSKCKTGIGRRTKRTKPKIQLSAMRTKKKTKSHAEPPNAKCTKRRRGRKGK